MSNDGARSSPSRADGSYDLVGERRPPVAGQTRAVHFPVGGSLVGHVHE